MGGPCFHVSHCPTTEPGEFGDPFRVLEHILLGLERDETKASLPVALIDWKETLEENVIRVDLPGLKEGELKIEVEETGWIGDKGWLDVF